MRLDEILTELSDKRLNKYVKKATKSADALEYYSDSRNDPDWDKAQKRKKMVDVAKDKLDKSVKEAGMPASIIKTKQAYSMKSPQELLAVFKEVSERTGKSIQELAINAARRHGYADVNTYWNRIQPKRPDPSTADGKGTRKVRPALGHPDSGF